ncbi:MAG: aminomethyl-transferring glycine dehydrogenase subunit GcvPA [Chloroflexi bacterium]|nr:MAG: aminomethyl-transferring glycine dehydrogenase subunit GcvPA [Chloroflexota bacterium]
MAYLPNTDAERTAMLARVGASTAADLFTAIPAALRNPSLDLPPPLSEQDLVVLLEGLAARNRSLSTYRSFLGAGVYRRFSPAIVRASISRPEFYTAYTPYQAEASQGTLQSIFEFQSMICALTGLDVANASMYDGATAAAEAMVLAVQTTKRTRIAVTSSAHPETLRVLHTFAEGRHIDIDVIAEQGGRTSPAALAGALNDQHAAVLVQHPSFLGTLEELAEIAEIAHSRGALAICSTDLHACAALVPPGDAGFDVAVGDGQPLGIPASFGGPHVGFMAVREALLRRIPGRLAGMTTDHSGRRAYTLTLQAREQHIRREHATSNICTNHALIALAATVYMAYMGAGGMRTIAEVSALRAHHLAARLAEIEGFSLAYPDTPFLWEFVLRTPVDGREFARALRESHIIAGLPLGDIDSALDDHVLVCCTELTSPDSIERYVAAAKRVALDAAEQRVPVATA